MPYSKTTWADNSAPAIDAANLNNIESGVAAAPYGPDATANQIPVGNGSAWVYQLLKNAQVDPAAAIAYSKLALAGSLVNADVATGAAIAYAKLNLAAAVKDSDIASAQNLSKLAAVTGTPTGAKFLRDDGTWNLPAGLTSYRKSTATAVNNTVAATDLLAGSITVAAGVLGTTGRLRLTAFGDWKNNSGASAAPPRIQLVLGGTTLLDTGTGPGVSATNVATRYGWSLQANIANLGAANSQWANLHGEFPAIFASGNAAFTTGEGNYFSTPGGSVLGVAIANGGNAAAVDTTAALALVLNVINGAANVNYETKLYSALVEVI